MWCCFLKWASLAIPCADLFRQPVLLRAAEAAVRDLLAWTADWDGILVFGCPVAIDGEIV